MDAINTKLILEKCPAECEQIEIAYADGTFLSEPNFDSCFNCMD
jgi:hypothetical protein